MKVKLIAKLIRLSLVLVLAFSFFLAGPATTEAEKIGVLLFHGGEPEDYGPDFWVNYMDHLYPVLPYGFFAGGPKSQQPGKDCYTTIHYASEAEAAICSIAKGTAVTEGTPIDVFCDEYTDNETNPIHSAMDHRPAPGGDGTFTTDCFDEDGMGGWAIVLLTLSGDTTVAPGGTEITAPHVHGGSGIGIADFLETRMWSSINDHYEHYPDYRCPNDEMFVQWVFGGVDGGEVPTGCWDDTDWDTSNRSNVLDALLAAVLADEEIDNSTEIAVRIGSEGYFHNIDVYRQNTEFFCKSAEQGLIELMVDEEVDRVIVTGSSSTFSNMTQWGPCWRGLDGQGYSMAVVEGSRVTFKECTLDITDGYGPDNQTIVDLIEYRWDWAEYDAPYPVLTHLVNEINDNNSTEIPLTFTKSPAAYDSFAEGVVELLEYSLDSKDYSDFNETFNMTGLGTGIPDNSSIEVIIQVHGSHGGQFGHFWCDFYWSDTEELLESSRAAVEDYLDSINGGSRDFPERRMDNGTLIHPGYKVLIGQNEFAQPGEGTFYDEPSEEKPFGDINGCGEYIDKATKGKYVNELGALIDNNENDRAELFDYVVVIPITWETDQSDTMFHGRSDLLGNIDDSEMIQGELTWTRQHDDWDGEGYANVSGGKLTYDSEYYTVRQYDGEGWCSVPISGFDSNAAECTATISETDLCDNSTLLPGSNPPACTYACAPVVCKGDSSDFTTVIITGTATSIKTDDDVRRLFANAQAEAVMDAIKTPGIGGHEDEECIESTLITLSAFKAKPGNRSVTLIWQTESEIDNAGFNLYRAESADGPYVKINYALIHAEGSPTQGTAYEFVDKGLDNRKIYYYKLEDIDLNGMTTQHGPISATPKLFYWLGM